MSRETPSLIVVSCIVEGGDGEVLICLPAGATDAPRIWEFPTGTKEVRESHEAAMRRVCRQRIGLGVTIRTGQPPLLADYQGQPAVYRFFVASVASGAVEPRDYGDVRWIRPGQLCEYDYSDTTQKVVDWYVA